MKPMVKVSELANGQLLKQIQKYRKILDVLIKEREQRLAKGHPGVELFSNEELAKMRAHSSAPKEVASGQESADDSTSPEITASQSFQLEIDVEEIEKIREEQERARQAKDEEEEEVRVTQLIKLSKEQLAELKKSSKKK
jgi:hypothetical protein